MKFPILHQAMRRRFLPVAVVVVLVFSWLGVHPALSSDMPAGKTPETKKLDIEDSAEQERAIVKPRIELVVPSVRQFVTEVTRSHAGVFVSQVRGILLDVAEGSADGVSSDAVAAVLSQVARWPDSSVEIVTFAPDWEGRTRWAIRLHWSLGDLYARAKSLLESEVGRELLIGVSILPGGGNGFVAKLGEAPLAFLMPGHGATNSIIASHADLLVPETLFRGNVEDGEVKPLVSAKLRLAGSEKDSGATFLSSFSAVTAVDYQGHVSGTGDWVERIKVHWPPILGVGAKAVFSRVKQTFFTPGAAFGSFVVNSPMIPAMLDNVAGFGPQTMMSGPGQMEVIGDAMPGPIASQVGKTVSVTVLPGTGFLPAPDIVVQTRIRKPDKVMADLRLAAARVNSLFLDREKREPWYEVRVRDRLVLWSDSGSQSGFAMLPFVLRPVIFATQEKDGKGKDRNLLVIAWTSTSPETFVRRWLAFPRTKERQYLPTHRKTNGQAWINWKLLYQWVHPYINIGMSGASIESMWPSTDEVEGHLTDAFGAMKTSFSGLNISYQGPLPIGVMVLPGMLAASVAPDLSGGSDLARERLASQRLLVFFHHAKLFRKDFGRWPAEIGELDGYVDFAGNPGLLRLQLSSKKQWNDWIGDMFEAPEKSDEDEEDEVEEELKIDDKLFVVKWGREKWTLGYAPKTLDHLESLFIDQDGKLHRVPNKQESAPLSADASAAAPETKKNQPNQTDQPKE